MMSQSQEDFSLMPSEQLKESGVSGLWTLLLVIR